MLTSLGFVEEGVGREDGFLDGDYHDTHYFGVLDREWRERDGGDERDDSSERDRGDERDG
jgi:hypothetical protein